MLSMEKNISEIIYKHLQEDNLSEEERSTLDRWLAAAEDHRNVLSKLGDTAHLQQDLMKLSFYEERLDDAWERFRKERITKVHLLRTIWFRSAAAVIILFGIGTYGWMHTQDKSPISAGSRSALVGSNIPPGKSGAILTLSDGSRVVLDSLTNGVIAAQNGAQVILKKGLLAYDPDGQRSKETVYNTMSTPKGRQFQLILPDGSKVWLNAASSIKYPTVFTGRERVVEMEGEAYFEIAKNPKVPFKVKANRTEVEVLGTGFNVNGYNNEAAVTTTLIEGAVKINTQKRSVTLKPGQQAQTLANTEIQVVNGTDINQVMAWKNGHFDFNNADLQMMMRQLERWYDIQVVYEGTIPDVIFKGKMDRDVQLSDVVRFLKLFGIRARLEERVLTISGN